MSNQPIKLGIMSFAHGHAYSYASTLPTMPGVTLAGIYDDDPQRGQAAAQRYGIPFFAEANALLDQGLDGVMICAENAKHRPLVELAAGRTPHILCEKPIATTAEDGQAMIDLCQRTGTKLQIAFPVRFSPPIQWLKATLDKGDLGNVYAVQTTNHGSMPGGWFVDKALAG
ncbi:MAG: Gfo/Idh/MocA family protein, partial [Caldilineaceae bacterium]